VEEADTRHAGGKPHLSRGSHPIKNAIGLLEKFAKKVNEVGADSNFCVISPISACFSV
jgi:hypothetical protein